MDNDSTLLSMLQPLCDEGYTISIRRDSDEWTVFIKLSDKVVAKGCQPDLIEALEDAWKMTPIISKETKEFNQEQTHDN